MLLTDRQRAAVVTRGPEVLVTASAGSGKTEVLARRVMSLITDDLPPCRLDRLLVVTFTRAAAAELRARVGRLLHAELAASSDPARRRLLRRQEALLDSAEIGTIDSWCGRLVRTHFARAGVDPGFVMLNPLDAAQLRHETLESVMDWVYLASDAGPARDLLARSAKPGDRWLRELVERLNRFREHLADPDAWLSSVRRRSSLGEEEQRRAARADWWAELRTEVAEQAAHLPERVAAIHASSSSRLAAYQDQLERWFTELSEPDRLDAVLASFATYRIPRQQRTESPGDAVKALIDEVSTKWFRARLKQDFDLQQILNYIETAPHLAGLTRTLLDLEQRYHHELTIAKQRRSAYEFSDVLRFARQLLHPSDGQSPVAARIAAEYDAILIDEFQDTSPLQVALFDALRNAATFPGGFFYVGDVKQSIYGFRRAEPRLFTQRATQLRERPTAGVVLPLTDNFRTHERLLRGLNGWFTALFDPEFGGAEYDEHQRLDARRAELPNPTLDAEPRIQVLLIDGAAPTAASDESDGPGDENEAAAEPSVESNSLSPSRGLGPTEAELTAVELQAAALAAELARLQAAGAQVLARGPDDQPRLRPLQLADVAVLLRVGSVKAGQVARMLRNHGVPCVTSGRESIFDALEVHDLCHALSLIVNLHHDVALAAYLRGPLVGLSEAELLAIRQNTTGGDYAAAVRAAAARTDALGGRVAAALDQLDRWRRAARTRPAALVLRQIIHETALDTFTQAQPSGAQRVAALEALLELAGPTASVADVVAQLDALAALDQSPDAPVAARGDAVRIMTIHASKGLEFPVVFLLNADAPFSVRSKRASLQLDDELGLGLALFDAPLRTALQDVQHRRIGRQIEAREREEDLRLLYVAGTRARERLYVVGAVDKKRPWADILRSTAPHALSLAERRNAKSMLEWVLRATAARSAMTGESSTVLVRTIDSPAALAPAAPPSIAAPTAEPPRDAFTNAQIAETLALLHAESRTAAMAPAVLSVSAVKDFARRAGAEEIPAAVTDLPATHLALPEFGAVEPAPDGRDLGTAAHRFLQFADLTQLTSAAAVRAQIDALTRAGRLTAVDAALVDPDAMAWFATQPLGRALATHAAEVMREVAFVHGVRLTDADDLTLIRGVIDVLVRRPDGLWIIDYKTDRIANDAQLRDRRATYSLQLRLYAQAAAAILGQPVRRAELVFLAARRIETVELSPVPVGELWRAAQVGTDG